MIEIPESQTLARQLSETIAGKTVAEVTVNASPHKFAFFYGDPAAYGALLSGKTAQGAQAFGGQVEIALEDVRLVFNDGDRLRYLEPGAKAPAKHQLLLRFGDGSSIVCSVLMYGGIYAFRAGENDNYYYNVARQKPSPLSDAFDEGYFRSLLGSTVMNLSVKAFLATEQRIPGLGNGVLQDILYRAKVHPREKLDSLTDGDAGRLFFSVRDTLREMTGLGGRDTEPDLFGLPGGYRTVLSRKTLGKACPVCGRAILRQAYLGGNVYFCPCCQSLH